MSDDTGISKVLDVHMEAAARARAAYKRKKLVVIPSQCGTCPLDSTRMKLCLFAGDDDCKHTATLGTRARMKDKLARLRAGKVPNKFWPEIEKIDSCEALVAVRRVLAGEASIAVLLGSTGVGKSLCGALAVAERGGIFAAASGLAGSEERVDPILQPILEASLVVLDDVGRARSATPAAIERTEDVLCTRFDRKLPTIVTANLLPWKQAESDPPGFWDLFGGAHGRIADRLGGVNLVTLCSEASRRRAPELWDRT